jgi:hypothetical protein
MTYANMYVFSTVVELLATMLLTDSGFPTGLCCSYRILGSENSRIYHMLLCLSRWCTRGDGSSSFITSDSVIKPALRPAIVRWELLLNTQGLRCLSANGGLRLAVRYGRRYGLRLVGGLSSSPVPVPPSSSAARHDIGSEPTFLSAHLVRLSEHICLVTCGHLCSVHYIPLFSRSTTCRFTFLPGRIRIVLRFPIVSNSLVQTSWRYESRDARILV